MALQTRFFPNQRYRVGVISLLFAVLCAIYVVLIVLAGWELTEGTDLRSLVTNKFCGTCAKGSKVSLLSDMWSEQMPL